MFVGSAPKISSSPDEGLFKTEREVLKRELAAGQTEAEIMSLLGVTKTQAKAWLARMLKEGAIEKVKKTKPVQYRTASASGRLL